MEFLKAFDALTNSGLDQQAAELLYFWIIHREKELYRELHQEPRPVLKFKSWHPGNPDFYSTDKKKENDEKKPGWAYLLTSQSDVQLALDELSMRPYESWDKNSTSKDETPWVLSMNQRGEHKSVWVAMHQSMIDPDLNGKIARAVQRHWGDAKANLGYIDVRQYFRRVALSFTGEYFGIPSSFIFGQAPSALVDLGASPSGIENLEQWSGEGYENFIWKIHARHFDSNMPGRDGAYLKKIYGLVLGASKRPMKDTVIERFALQPAPPRIDPLRNIVGMIQGLVDNMMVNACIALNQIINKKLVDVAAGWDLPQLVAEIRSLQAANEAPSPFLPRFGEVTNPNDGKSILDKYPHLKNANIACAVGAAMIDPANSGYAAIRLGYGMHECIGRELGDWLTAAALQPLLALQSLQVVRPLVKQWGWIPLQYVVATNHPQRRNQVIVDQLASAAPPRPAPFSQWSSSMASVQGYSSWPSLTDRGWFSRHLGPADNAYKSYLDSHVSTKDVTALFYRPQGGVATGRSTLLFSFFAQWLIDSFLRTDHADRRRTSSNHHLDLCQIYGLDDRTTRILRSGSEGKMKLEIGPSGDEYPPRLFDASGNIKLEFQGLPYVANGQLAKVLSDFGIPHSYLSDWCASGLERGNSTVGYTALNTLFLREHNRVCTELKKKEGTKWSDERLFQTARMIMILIEIKIIVGEYINHINTNVVADRPFQFDPAFLFAEHRRWYRTNWISVEFDLLYRWHGLVPDKMSFGGGAARDSAEMRGYNRPLFDLGLGRIFADASNQPAGRVQLFNTPKFLWGAEGAAVAMARAAELMPFNEYRKRFGIPPMKGFDEFNDTAAGNRLRQIYGSIDRVEFLPGIIAEQPAFQLQDPPRRGPPLFGLTMMTMVGHDAFTHALTNPLLSANVLTRQHLTQTGLDIVVATSSLNDLLERNGEGRWASFDWNQP
jgi:prostaglandin-endoperoxide synthase 2